MLTTPRRFDLGKAADATDGTHINVGVMIASVRRTQTKKDGKPMAMLTVEDLTGKCDAVVFPRVYEQVVSQLEPEAMVFLHGTIDRSRERANIMVDEVLGIDRAIGELTGAIELRVGPTNHTPELLEALRELLTAHKGACAVRLMVTPAHRPDVKVQVPLGNDWRITPSRDLADKLVELLGDQNALALEPRKIVKKEDPRQRFRKQPART